MYQATKDISSRVNSGKKPRIYCRRGETLIPLTDKEPIIVATKTEVFSVIKEEIKRTEMGLQKLISAVKDVSNNPHITAKTFPYAFVTGITEGKEWEKEFVEALKKSDIDKEIKQKLIEIYETPDLR